MNTITWLSIRLKHLVNIALVIICTFSYLFFIKILSDKEKAVETIRGSSEIKFAFDDYWILNFIFGWPLIIMLLIGLGWVYFKQFKAPNIGQKLKANAIALLLFFIAWIGWLACLYYPSSQLVPVT